MNTPNQRPLRAALSANAAFSLGSGGLMILSPGMVGEWLGLPGTILMQILGVGLVAFAFDLLHQATRPRLATWRALYASAGDFLWVIGSVAWLGLDASMLSGSGVALVSGVAVVVLGFGTWQAWGILRVHRLPVAGRYRHCLSVGVSATADEMWSVMSDLGSISRYMPMLARSEIVGGRSPGLGAVRVCEDRSGNRWAEKCIEFVPERRFAVRFLADEPDFPFPVKAMGGGWEVAPADSGSKVTVWWELEPRCKEFAPILLPLLAFQADRQIPKVIRHMAAEVRRRTQEPDSSVNGGLFARILPDFC